jgi:penicillin G amidase
VLQRFLKYTNIAVLVFLLVLVTLLGWFGWRTLPAATGTVEAPIRAEGVIRRDALGVPHIEAGSLEDAVFLQGYATAQDRLWQLDALRRSTAGELAEIVGAAAVPIDLNARRMGFRRVALMQQSQMEASDRLLFAAYARGVNHFIDTHRDALPPEFTLLSYEPSPWTINDSILVALRMAEDLSSSWRTELDAARMRQELAATFPDMGAEERDGLMQRLFPIRSGEEALAGSNAWALSGKWTASGKPLLANDTHLSFSMPSTWTMVHLKAPDLDVKGFALPGLPGVIIGHNQRIAWGITNLGPDVQDLYEERIDLATGRYQYGDEIRQAQKLTEVIRVKGGAEIRLNVLVTHHGPLIQTTADEPSPGNIALRWTAFDADFVRYPFLDLNRAGNWEEFRAALSRFPGPPQNLLYADVDGNIGYQATGRIPQRPHSGVYPVPGHEPGNEWGDYIPFDDLPRIYNPGSGWIVSANQSPFPPDYRYAVNGGFASPDRANQIIARIRTRQDWEPAGLLDIQKDVYSPHYVFIARAMLQAAERKPPADPMVQRAMDILRDWNGQAELDEAGATIARVLSEQTRIAILKVVAPNWDDAKIRMSDAVVQRILQERPALWSNDYDTWLMEIATDVLQQGRQRMGSDLTRWKYREVSGWNADHPIFSRVPLVGRYFSLGRVAMSGSPSSPKQVSRGLGPSQRFVADLGDWERSLANVTVGISGHPFSSHYRDQWKAYYAGESFPMPFAKMQAETEQHFLPTSGR